MYNCNCQVNPIQLWSHKIVIFIFYTYSSYFKKEDVIFLKITNKMFLFFQTELQGPFLKMKLMTWTKSAERHLTAQETFDKAVHFTFCFFLLKLICDKGLVPHFFITCCSRCSVWMYMMFVRSRFTLNITAAAWLQHQPMKK